MSSHVDHVAFFERPYPSANTVLLRGPRPILVDPGFGSDVQDMLQWLRTNGVPAEKLALIVNTHYHSDHVGGNHALQFQYATPIAAHTIEADAVNRRDPSVCAATWLRQPVESYEVQRSLNDGDVLDTGETTWEVLHTPGHTRGHMSLYSRTLKVLVAGDTAHVGDLGWLNPYIEGADSLERSLDTLARLASLGPQVMFSGHGPAAADPQTALDAARARLTRWRINPEGAAWHAAKRIFAYALMIEDGLAEHELAPYLATSRWVDDIAAAPFGMAPAAFAQELIATMLQSNAIEWRSSRLVARAPHVPPARGWPSTPTLPAEWSAP